jgi:hypothetical protein
LSFVGGTAGAMYPSTIYFQISNPYACIYVFILILQNAYFCPLNYGIPFLYKFFLSMIYLSVVKLISERTCSDSNCWITKRGSESVIEKFNPF